MTRVAPITMKGQEQSDHMAPMGRAPAVMVGWRTWGFVLLLTGLFLSLLLLPRVHSNQTLVWTFGGVAAGLLAWQALLWTLAAKGKRTLAIELVAVKSHYVQAIVQFLIMLWWGWNARNAEPVGARVFHEAPLILSQLLYFYVLEALFTWSRGKTWRLGFGPMPIILSTNLLLWFKDDWFYLQFAMLLVGMLGKQFVTWNREGKRTHIFNPSAFGQFMFALVLIYTGTTNELTWGRDIATTFEVPHMLVVIFLLGFVVQYLFHVTLMTVAAVATIVLFNEIYYASTGLYFFVSINVAAPIFLGVHLLITDPATSPRSNTGRVIFGVLYGLGYCILFRLLDLWEVPLFWDKLLPVPILNLMVPLIDRMCRSGFIGTLNRAWETALTPAKMNLIHMGSWAALFATMWSTGYIEGPHPGNSIPFWKQAFVDGKSHAGHSLVIVTGGQAEVGRSGPAFNELGVICMEGQIVSQKPGKAAHYFGQACGLGNVNGCANVAIQFLFLSQYKSPEDVVMALDNLERECDREPDWAICFLVGSAYEQGRGRPKDLQHAIELYLRCGWDNIYACKGLARIGLAGGRETFELTGVVPTLMREASAGDAEACWYLAYMHRDGNGVPQDEAKAREYMARACMLGNQKACEAVRPPNMLPYTKPSPMLVPSWSTAFPVEKSDEASTAKP